MDTPRQRSPYGLIQEEFRDQPWKLLVCCMCLNMTSIVQVRPIITQLFATYPTPAAMAAADQPTLASMVRSLGLYNRRSRAIIALSHAFTRGWSDVMDLPGIGKYAADSYRIFVDGKIDVEPSDAKLKKYIDWARSL